MAAVQTLEQVVRARVHECSEAIAREFRVSVRPIYGSSDGVRPEPIGSCLLLNVDGTKFVVTAAHIIDLSPTYSLYVGGVVGTEPTQITGEVKLTAEPAGGRDKDRFDCAFWAVPPSVEHALGAVTFIAANDVAPDRVDPTNRAYMALGYPLSKNRKQVHRETRSITTVAWKYTADVSELPALAAELGISGKDHLFLTYGKYSWNSDGTKVSAVQPRGVSGGALIDLGNYASPSSFAPNAKCTGKLAGMVIEKDKKHHALVAVKIGKIIEAIRNLHAP